ncbi:hypothetical protein TRAPUB_1845 [Trametes pubescens]|uniref:Redoxin domain-containing protein n=1 Tax=Trametes pubescens TaxID=154538 RepID=A0A1M2VI98_TRAPU|nr:hypothetical protein TRAPUB_1845 [Trametes pubescens]
MASLLAGATKTAHSLATSLLSAAEAKAGSTLPVSVPVKEDDAEKPFTFAGITGKNVFVGVPGAFTGTCSAQVPGYIRAYEQFRARGVENVYVVGVNDVFVMKCVTRRVWTWRDDGVGLTVIGGQGVEAAAGSRGHAYVRLAVWCLYRMLTRACGTAIHFIADDQGAFVGALGMLFDASPLLGSPRSKRFVAVTEGETISFLTVEPNPGEVTVTAVDKIVPWV